MMTKSLLVALILPLIAFGGADALQLRCIPSPNLIKNASFSEVNANGKPLLWTFDNCSKSPLFKSHILRNQDGNCIEISSDWQKYGYWLQKVAVTEGQSYYASVEVQSDAPTPAIWLRARSPEKRGNLEYVIRAYFYHNGERKTCLKDFIDEKLISTLDAQTWNRIGQEIKIPSDRQIKSLDVRIGIAGGDAGAARYRNPVLRRAESTLEIKVSGKNWIALNIKGAKPASVKLDPAKSEQTISVLLPVSCRIYKVELSGRGGRKISKEIANE